MIISFDMQAFQSANRIGGIGKYNYDYLKTLFQLYPENTYNLLFNGQNKYPETTNWENISGSRSKNVMYLPGNDWNPINKWIGLCNLHYINTDIFHIISPFESQQNTVIPNKRLPAKTVVTIYDFIPYIYQNLYLSSPTKKKQYFERTKIMESASLMLAISDATRQDAINLFNVPPKKIINIGIAPSDDYYNLPVPEGTLQESVKKRFNINKQFLLTVSNTDYRKNLPALLKAFSSLPKNVLKEFILVVVTNSQPQHIETHPEISQYLSEKTDAEIKIIYSANNHDLCTLYNTCSAFIYASLYEGGGLPVIEAMKCGAAVIASNTSSIPEFAGRIDNLFDPKNIDDIRNAIENILTNETFRQEIQRHGLEFSKTITWENVVTKAMKAYKNLL
ncbi:MAG: glycosyltransferase family 4 protein [Anaerolineae bacterium]|nr:glycosyltransferase family 4 protein [Anaerolineae bacterium]